MVLGKVFARVFRERFRIMFCGIRSVNPSGGRRRMVGWRTEEAREPGFRKLEIASIARTAQAVSTCSTIRSTAIVLRVRNEEAT